MTAAAPHRQGIDLARFLAAFGVVASHCYSSKDEWIGHVSVAMFLILTAFLSVRSMQRAGGRFDVWGRAKRLLLPWLAFSLFFRIVALKVNDGPDKYALLSDPFSLLVGSTVHLWFLPFVMVAALLVKPAVRLITTQARLAAALLALIVVSLPMLWAHGITEHPPLPQWLVAFPVYCLGLALGIAYPLGRPLWPLAAAAVMSSGALLLSHGAHWGWTVFAGVLAFEAFWRLPWRGDWLRRLGEVSFGIYLVHPFFLLVVYKFLGGDVGKLLATGLTFAMSWAVVDMARRLPVFAKGS